MAASRDSSNSPDWQDCRVIMREMEQAMEARVELTMRPYDREGKEGLVVKATAYPHLSVVRDQRQSVSLSVNILHSSTTMVAAVIFRLLIALDYEVSKAWAIKQTT